MDQTTGAQRPGLPFLSRTNRLRAEGGGLARRPERCNPGYRPGGERSGAAAKLCPLNDGGENHPGAAPGTSTDASAASVGPHLFLGRPEARIPGLGSDQRRGRSAPPVLLASFLRSKTSDAQGRGTPPIRQPDQGRTHASAGSLNQLSHQWRQVPGAEGPGQVRLWRHDD